MLWLLRSGTQNINSYFEGFYRVRNQSFCMEEKKGNLWKREREAKLKRDHRMDKPRGKICDGSLTVDWDIYSVVVKEIR